MWCLGLLVQKVFQQFEVGVGVFFWVELYCEYIVFGDGGGECQVVFIVVGYLFVGYFGGVVVVYEVEVVVVVDVCLQWVVVDLLYLILVYVWYFQWVFGVVQGCVEKLYLVGEYVQVVDVVVFFVEVYYCLYVYVDVEYWFVGVDGVENCLVQVGFGDYFDVVVDCVDVGEYYLVGGVYLFWIVGDYDLLIVGGYFFQCFVGGMEIVYVVVDYGYGFVYGVF